ncbi:YdiU family protein [Meridianimarinicoccus sp. MJW13]|uniref:protein adenylyltransferase SelO n=1 Tax=Meridianimarinicoccus sp. MJW13 TaxID=2720031 RepID=UPI0018663911|nr:YdiU family protein [Fluviibacterium sp. MJW13]
MTLQIPFDNSYARLPDRFYVRQPADPVTRPGLIVINAALAADLGIEAEALASEAGLAVLAGNAVPEGAAPLAQAYAGHQFGGWSPQLGDGRALLLGEVLDRNGNRRDIQLKGSGRTPFSRMGDGRAWLGPVLREYVVSETMHAMGIPSTRALAAVTTGDRVFREGGAMPGAVLTRVAASHIRVGTFQYFAARGDEEAVRLLADHARTRHYPQAETALDLLNAVIDAQARLIAKWLGVGFIHGVMNTDNMTISGETIDYGPCAFMDRFESGKVFSSIDQFGRYAYNRQPDIAVWNIAQLATCLLPLIDPDQDRAVEIATKAVHRFPEVFAQEWLAVFRAKLGLTADPDDGDLAEADSHLINDLLSTMETGRADFTNTFAGLATGTAEQAFADPAPLAPWQARHTARLAQQGGADTAAMGAANPQVIPRNHMIEAMISSGVEGDLAPFRALLETVTRPFDAAPESFTRPPEPDEEVRQTFCGT